MIKPTLMAMKGTNTQRQYKEEKETTKAETTRKMQEKQPQR